MQALRRMAVFRLAFTSGNMRSLFSWLIRFTAALRSALSWHKARRGNQQSGAFF